MGKSQSSCRAQRNRPLPKARLAPRRFHGCYSRIQRTVLVRLRLTDTQSRFWWGLHVSFAPARPTVRRYRWRLVPHSRSFNLWCCVPEQHSGSGSQPARGPARNPTGGAPPRAWRARTVPTVRDARCRVLRCFFEVPQAVLHRIV